MNQKQFRITWTINIAVSYPLNKRQRSVRQLSKNRSIIITNDFNQIEQKNMINDYRLIKKLGQGSTAQVWEANQETCKTKCAIKIFFAADDSKELIRNEVK